MEQGRITVFCGEGKGKTSAALGQAIFGASKGRSVIIIQFLKGKAGEGIDFIKRLEPEIKVFSFEKSDANFQELSPEEQGSVGMPACSITCLVPALFMAMPEGRWPEPV